MVNMKTLSDAKLKTDMGKSISAAASQLSDLQQRLQRPLTVDGLAAIEKEAALLEKSAAKLREQAKTARAAVEHS